MSGSLDLPRLQLEIGDGVGTRAVGEDEIAIDLVGIDAHGLGTHEDIADPHGVRVLALECALVEHRARAMGSVVVDEDTMLEVLAGIGEVEPEQLSLPTRRTIGHQGAQSDEVATQGHVCHEQACIAAEMRRMRADVHGIAIPGLVGDDRCLGSVAHADLDVAREHRGTAMLDHDRALAEGCELDDEVARCGCALAGHHDTSPAHGLSSEREHHGPRRAGQRLGSHDVGGDEGGAHPRVIGGHGLREETLGLDGDVHAAREVQSPGMQPLKSVERRETPLLLAPRRDGMIRDGARAYGRRVVARRDGDGHQPTAPSIWSSISRFNSSAYSIGSSRAMGSTNPRTIMAMASSSVIPRDMR